MTDFQKAHWDNMDQDETAKMEEKNMKQDVKKSVVPILVVLTAALIVLYLLIFMTGTVFAASVTIRPDAVLSAGAWTLTANDVNDSTDATYALIDDTTDTFTVSLADNAAYDLATINSATVYVRGAVFTAGNPSETFTFGVSQPVLSTSTTQTFVRNTPTDHSFVPTGIDTAWDVNAMEVDVTTTALDVGEQARIYEVWVVVDYTPAGPNEITSCDGCHQEPPLEAASRDGSTGAVVGSHASHSAYACTTCHPDNTVLNHRGAGSGDTSGSINMLASIQSGYYDQNNNSINDDSGGFAQDNDITGTTLATCRNVSCHNGTQTPQWGNNGTLDCTSCHGAPPTTNAHEAHYTAKAAQGWSNPDTGGTSCDNCHPDNTITHSPVNDATIELDATLSASGSGATTRCNAPALGCHNGKETPQWGTTNIACTDCHTPGGTDPADPTTGLHDETPTVSGVIHNPTDPNFSGCDTCHTSAPSDSHWDGAVQTSAPVINFNTPSLFTFTDGTPPTCTSTCHADSGITGPWQRRWHENSDQTTGEECAGCHGDWANGWNSGVTHRTDTSGGSSNPYTTHGTGTNYECKDCHALEAATGYDFDINTNPWGGTSEHGNGNITINTNGHTFGRSGGLSGCLPCHSQYDGTDGNLDQHSFTTTGWNLEQVSGDSINAGCDSCHGGAGQYWPSGSSYPNTEGRHDEHMAMLANQLGYTLAALVDAEQKHMCAYCHPDPGGNGHSTNNAPTDIADVSDINPVWDATNPPSTTDSGASFNTTDGSCASIDCHNNQATGAGTYGWRDAGTSVCTMCHTAGGGVANEIINPTTGLHDEVPTVSGVIHNPSDPNFSGCEDCHTANPSTAHWDGNPDNDSPTVTLSGSIGFVDNDVTQPTCANSCHEDGGAWSRLWHENSDLNNGPSSATSECAGCHGTFATGFTNGVGLRHQTTSSGDADGDIAASHDGVDPCYTCHTYKAGDTTYYNFATDHRDNSIQISDQVGFVPNVTASTVGCNGCHNPDGGTGDEGHEFTDVSALRWGNRTITAGPAAGCTTCHNGTGGGPNNGKNVSATSPHAQNNGNFNFAGTGVTGCEDCHFDSHSNQASGTINIPNNPALGLDYNQGGTGIYIVAYGGATNEAEACWNCHTAASAQSAPFEFNGTGSWYTEGTLSQSDWTGASWTSDKFAYKAGLAIHSTHEVGEYTTDTSPNDGNIDYPVPASSMANTDKAANSGGLKCTWCHDVHGIKGFPRQNAAQSYNSGSGLVDVTWNDDNKVFLRGPWYSSPYNEDGAPTHGSGGTTGGFTYPANVEGATDQNDDPGPVSVTWGSADPSWSDTISGTSTMAGPNHVVRVQSLATTNAPDYRGIDPGSHLDDNVYGTNGGYGYDPSNGDMAGGSGATLGTVNHIDYSATTNLCMMCHGTLANLKTLWSGHNAVRGGTAADTNDIFTPKNAINQHYMYNEVENSFAHAANNLGYAGETTSDGWGTGSLYTWSVNLQGQVATTTVDSESAMINVGGGGSTTVNPGGAPKQKFHQFTCSKCHSPHASANARLMITNCMNRDGTGANTYNVRESGPGRIVGSGAATDVTNILGVSYPDPQNDGGQDISDPWISLFGGHERTVHCHNNVEQASGNYWQEIP